MTINPVDHLGLAYSLTRQFIRRRPLFRRHEGDLLAEATLAVVKAARDFDPSRGFKFATLAGRYIVNRFGNFAAVETRAERVKLCGNRLPDKADRHDYQAEADARMDVSEAIATLTDRQRAIVKRVYFNGEKQVDIAAEGGVTEQAIHWRNREAKRRIRERLTSYTTTTTTEG